MSVEERIRRADAMTARLAADNMARARRDLKEARHHLVGERRKALGEAWLEGVLTALLVWPFEHNKRGE